MNKKTIKIHTAITRFEAIELSEQGIHLCFTQNGGDSHQFWTDPMELESIHPNRTEPYKPYHCGPFRHCAKVTEINPCQSPDGCPELEPWMAYVGDQPLNISSGVTGGVLTSVSVNELEDEWCTGYTGNLSGYFYAIDVRTAWAKEHFPEHCRIRAYQEPSPIAEVDHIGGLMIELYGAAAVDLMSPLHFDFIKAQVKAIYERGQANPTKGTQ
jgi:hypothetical protein